MLMRVIVGTGCACAFRVARCTSHADERSAASACDHAACLREPANAVRTSFTT